MPSMGWTRIRSGEIVGLLCYKKKLVIASLAQLGEAICVINNATILNV